MAKKEWTEPKPMCEKLQYLIGVPSQYIDNFDTLNKGVMIEVRKLCALRSMIIANFTGINDEFRNRVQLADISLTARYVADLAKCGINIVNSGSLSRNIIELNDEPVFNATEMKSYDVIPVGSTKLMLIGLCGKRFNWAEGVKHE